MTQEADAFASLDYGPAPESASAVRDWIADQSPFDLFVGGEVVAPASDDRFDTFEPATGGVLASLAQAGASDVDAAVAAARRAQPDWQALGGHGRARYLYAIARAVQRHGRFFAVLESIDNGKPIRETRDIDVPLVARHFYHHAGWAQLMETELAGFRPVGVAGQIIPWNFPLLMLAWKVAPALATGNTVVLKPAEYTSLTALRFAQLCQEIGLPPGVFNLVTGDGRTGELLVRHPDVDKIAFTGSTEVGRLIRTATAGSGKKLSLELGGKSPFLVFEDADLDAAVEGVVDAIWFNQGQVCCAGSRLLLEEGIADTVLGKLRDRMERLRVGDPLDKAIDIGAIVAPVQLERIERLVGQGADEGATVWQPSWSCPEDGWFYPPTLLTGVEPASTVARVEIFGPVIAAMTFRTPAEAVELANDTRYGLAASVWSENVNLALDVAPKLAAGVVWINSTNLFDAASGFGGYRESGFGREGGREGLFEYVVPNVVRPEATSDPLPTPSSTTPEPTPAGRPRLDRTTKQYIGGKQTRPDSGYSEAVLAADGDRLGEVGVGNRKDVRNAVEAARKAASWAATSRHLRAQILFYVAENLDARAGETIDRLARSTGQTTEAAGADVELSIARLFSAAAWADKDDGAVHHTPFRNVTLAMPEPVGILGIVCPDEAPLLAFVSLVGPAIAMGNRVVVVPSRRHPLLATDFYQVLDTSDVPGGVVNIVTGPEGDLTRTLAEHDAVDGLWYFGDAEGSALVERLSVGNLKQTWVSNGRPTDWTDPRQAEGRELLRRSTQIKNIWVPYGE